jgi:plasmid stabilization system protein ParE
MTPVAFLPGARRDFDQSFNWYASRSKLSAERFAIAVDDAISGIAKNPEQFAQIDSPHRCCLLKRYPFRIVYRAEAAMIVIVAIAHAKRRPGYWQSRT